MDLIDPVFRALLALCVVALVHCERARGIQVSSFQCIFWVTFALTTVLAGYGVTRDMAVEGAPEVSQGAVEED